MIDFEKLFNRVAHHIILAKLSHLRMLPHNTHLMQSFLCNRNQRAQHENRYLDWRVLKGLMPQETQTGLYYSCLRHPDVDTIVNC